ncbi:MAG: SpoIIIAH-like family protein [Bacilli bacterium]|nr:SpoIIIAH-like family protein [Bacilli bacterium]
MNKQNLWFLTLFSLILILGVYYITLPSDIFKRESTEQVSKDVDVSVSENNKLIARRVERDEKITTVMSELKDKIISSNTPEEKNSAFEELQVLNLSKGKETYLEDKINEVFKINSFVEINGDNISVTVASKEHNSSVANDLMRCVQEEFTEEKNITIKFES